MNRSARRYVRLALGLALGITGGMALFNYFIDPYNRYGTNRLGVYISAERECKSTYVTRYDHDTLLVGNSRMTGIAPRRLEGVRLFNGAFAGANAEEVWFFLQHFARNQKLVVLSIDAGAHDPAELKGDIFAPRSLDSVFDNLFNLKTTEYSIRTLRESLSSDPQPIGRDGEVPVADWIREADRDDPHAAQFVIQSLKRTWENYRCPPLGGLSFFSRIADLLKQRGIAAIVLIPPMHEEVARHVQNLPARQELENWKSELRTIFPEIVDLAFSPYTAATNFYRADPLHFKPDIGVRIMNEEVLPRGRRLGPQSAPAGPR